MKSALVAATKLVTTHAPIDTERVGCVAATVQIAGKFTKHTLIVTEHVGQNVASDNWLLRSVMVLEKLFVVTDKKV